MPAPRPVSEIPTTFPSLPTSPQPSRETCGFWEIIDSSILQSVNRARDWLEAEPNVRHMGAVQQRALDLLSSGAAHQAFDLGSEPARLRDRYGRHKAGQ